MTLAEVRTGLSRKATFERSLALLEQLLQGAPHPGDEAWQLLHRSFTILKSRYTNPGIWRSGAHLYASARASTNDPGLAKRLDTYLNECKAHIQDSEAPDPAQPARIPTVGQTEPFLFEGQLSQEGSIPPRRRTLEELVLALQHPATDDSESLDQQSQMREALEVELAVSLANASGEYVPSAAPPASKRAIRDLQRRVLQQSDMAVLGSECVMCAICREELEVGAEAQIMPCNAAHAFHPPCLAPWLAEHNSCPVCRHELPTEDQRYEAQKARQAQDAEDAKGRANALSHNEFMFI